MNLIDVFVCWIDRLAKDVVKEVKRRLQNKNPKVQLLTLTVWYVTFLFFLHVLCGIFRSLFPMDWVYYLTWFFMWCGVAVRDDGKKLWRVYTLPHCWAKNIGWNDQTRKEKGMAFVIIVNFFCGDCVHLLHYHAKMGNSTNTTENTFHCQFVLFQHYGSLGCKKLIGEYHLLCS